MMEHVVLRFALDTRVMTVTLPLDAVVSETAEPADPVVAFEAKHEAAPALRPATVHVVDGRIAPTRSGFGLR